MSSSANRESSILIEWNKQPNAIVNPEIPGVKIVADACKPNNRDKTQVWLNHFASRYNYHNKRVSEVTSEIKQRERVQPVPLDDLLFRRLTYHRNGTKWVDQYFSLLFQCMNDAKWYLDEHQSREAAALVDYQAKLCLQSYHLYDVFGADHARVMKLIQLSD